MTFFTFSCAGILLQKLFSNFSVNIERECIFDDLYQQSLLYINWNFWRKNNDYMIESFYYYKIGIMAEIPEKATQNQQEEMLLFYRSHSWPLQGEKFHKKEAHVLNRCDIEMKLDRFGTGWNIHSLNSGLAIGLNFDYHAFHFVFFSKGNTIE